MATNAQLITNLNAIERNLKERGQLSDGSRLGLNEGSKSLGRTWKLVQINPDNGGQSAALGLTGGGNIGTTKAEALRTLETIRNVLSAI